MKDDLKIAIFISSVHYGLEDLRGELVSYLESLGALPLVSSEQGFPDHAGMSPYAQCLRVLESALMVLGIIDRRYGQAMEDWEPYPQYAGLSPTHAELRHALSSRKRLLVYHRTDLEGFYEIYRNNKDSFKDLKLPKGLEAAVLEMFSELKGARPAPWIESFRDVRDVKLSVRKRLLFDLYEALSRKERLSHLGVDLLLERLVESDPLLLSRVLSALDEMPEERRGELQKYLDSLVDQRGEEIERRATPYFARSWMVHHLALAA